MNDEIFRYDSRDRPASVSVERQSVTCQCGIESAERDGLELHRAELIAAAVVAAVQGPIKAEALREAAKILGHRDCPQTPDRDPYIGCVCRVSLLYARADRIEAQP